MASVEKTEEHTEAGYIKDENGRLIPDYDQTIKSFDDGDIVTGVVVKIDRDEVLVDIGYKSEGVIPIRELSIRRDINPLEVVVIGEELDALVLQKEDKDGRLILSKKRAEYEKWWVRVEEMSRNNTVLSGRVIEVVKGGLILDIGLRGFLPASLVDVRRVKDLHQFVGQELECKVIEMDRNRNNVVLSRRSVIDENRKQERDKVINAIKDGAILKGKVSSIVDFGAFVDLGGVDGLIHISEMSWSHIDHPSEILNLGDEVEVKVLHVEQDRGRISLGLKQCQDDPWKQKVKDLKIGDVVEGTVCKLVTFGAFISIADGVEGLVHISELSERHVEVPEHAVKIGEQVCAKIVDIETDRRRVSLSIKQAAEPADDLPEQEDGREVEVEDAGTNEPETVAETATETEEVPEPAPESTDSEDNIVLESGDSPLLAEALTTKADNLAPEASKALDQVLELDSAMPGIPDLNEEITLAEVEAQGDPGSLEDVLQKMKQTRSGKE